MTTLCCLEITPVGFQIFFMRVNHIGIEGFVQVCNNDFSILVEKCHYV